MAQNPVPELGRVMRLGFVLPKGVKKHSVPFEIHNNLIVINILLNNALPLKFILDTGVRTTVLTEKSLTDLLNLTYSRKITIPGAGGERLVDAYVANNVTSNISGMVGRGHSMLVLERDLLQLKNYLGVSVHGVLGYELFSRFIVEVNYDRKVVTFHDPDSFRKRRGYQELPMIIEDTKPYYYLNVTLRGNKVYRGKFMLDTGASHAVMIDERSSSELYVPDPHITSNLGRGLGGDITGEVARIDKVTLNEFDFENIIATFPDENSYFIDFDSNFRNGTIGGGMMSRFKIIFDFVNSKLYLKKGAKFKKPFEFNLSGLIVRASGLGLEEFIVAAVRAGSAAEEADVRIGDQIMMVNGQPTQDMKLNNILAILNSRQGKRVSLVLKRDGKTITKKFRLERLI